MYMYVYVCICMYMYVYVCICMYMYVYVCICMYMYVYVCICMYMYVYVCICMYMYVYVCICMYEHIQLIRHHASPETPFVLVKKTPVRRIRGVGLAVLNNLKWFQMYSECDTVAKMSPTTLLHS